MLPKDGPKMIGKLEKLLADHPEADKTYSFVRGECPVLLTQDGKVIYSTTLPGE